MILSIIEPTFLKKKCHADTNYQPPSPTQDTLNCHILLLPGRTCSSDDVRESTPVSKTDTKTVFQRHVDPNETAEYVA